MSDHEQGIAALDDPAPFKDRDGDARLQVLREAEATPYFDLVRATAVVALYDNPLVGKAFGYGGPSMHLGGYVNRGFDDLDSLRDPPDRARRHRPVVALQRSTMTRCRYDDEDVIAIVGSGVGELREHGLWLVGEDMPQQANRVTLNHDELDQFGQPVPNLHFDDHPNDLGMREPPGAPRGALRVGRRGPGRSAPAISGDARQRDGAGERATTGRRRQRVRAGARRGERLRLGCEPVHDADIGRGSARVTAVPHRMPRGAPEPEPAEHPA